MTGQLLVRPGLEHYCGLNVSPQCTPPTSGKPKRKRCPACAGEIVVHAGTYAIVPWRGDGRYELDQAIETRSTRAQAWAAAQKAGPEFVERFLPIPGESPRP